MSLPDSGIKTEPLYSFGIPRNVLLAIQIFQSTDETRAVLNAAKFEISRSVGPGHGLILVATDGRRLGVYDTEILPDSLLTGELPATDEFLIDLTGAKKLPKIKGDGRLVSVAVFERHVEISAGKYTYRTAKIEDKFPTWRQVLPTGELANTKEIAFNSKLLGAFGKAATMLTENETLQLGLRGKASAIVIQFPTDPEFTGVLMPVQLEKEEKADATVPFQELCKEHGTTVEIRAGGKTVTIDGNGVRKAASA